MRTTKAEKNNHKRAGWDTTACFFFTDCDKMVSVVECIRITTKIKAGNSMKNKLHLSYTAVQGAYCMLFAVVLSFSSVYLLEKGYTNTEIGTILALVNVISVFLQPIFGDAADRSKRLTLAQITVILAFMLLILTAMLFLFDARSVILTLVFVLLGGLMVSLSPIINSIAFRYSSFSNPINYGVARSGGSIAYSIISMVLGFLTLTFGANSIPAVGIAVLISLILALFATENYHRKGLIIDPDEEQRIKSLKPEEPISLIAFAKRNKMLFIFSFGTLLVFFQNAIVNNYLFQIITPLGGTGNDMGRIFSFMAFLELPGLFYFSRIKQKVSYQTMLKVSSIAFVFKVFFTYTATTVGGVYLAFMFQLISFPFYLAGSIHLVNEGMAKGEAVKGQSLVTGMMTLSAVFASLIGGMVLDSSGASSLLLISTILCIAGALVVFVSVGKIPVRK